MANRRTPPRSRSSGGSATVGLGIAVGGMNGVAVGLEVALGVVAGVGAGVEVAVGGTAVGIDSSLVHCNKARNITASNAIIKNLFSRLWIAELDFFAVSTFDSVALRRCRCIVQ